MITYQENWTGPFASASVQMERLLWLLPGFTTHCIIHREMLASQKLSPKLDSVLNDAIKVINHIKAHALNWRLFEQLCEEMDPEHKCLLLTLKWDGYPKGDRWPECLNYESRCRDFFQKRIPLSQHISVTWNGSQNLLTCMTCSTCTMNSICHFSGEWQPSSSWLIR